MNHEKQSRKLDKVLTRAMYKNDDWFMKDIIDQLEYSKKLSGWREYYKVKRARKHKQGYITMEKSPIFGQSLKEAPKYLFCDICFAWIEELPNGAINCAHQVPYLPKQAK